MVHLPQNGIPLVLTHSQVGLFSRARARQMGAEERLGVLPGVHEPLRQAVEGGPARDVIDQQRTSPKKDAGGPNGLFAVITPPKKEQHAENMGQTSILFLEPRKP